MKNDHITRGAVDGRRAFGLRMGSLVALTLAAGLTTLSSAQAAGPQKDPFAGDSWHAQAPSWPGAMVFDSKTKKVVLTPVGADAMEATYSYTIKPAPAGKSQRVVEGTLRMTNKEGQTSDSTFSITNSKELSLQFAGVQNQEKYVRLSAKEQVAEQDRLRKMILEGRTQPISKP